MGGIDDRFQKSDSRKILKGKSVFGRKQTGINGTIRWQRCSSRLTDY